MPRKPTKKQLQAMQSKENEQPEDVPMPNKATEDEPSTKVEDTNSPSRKVETSSKNKVSESVSSLQKSPQKRKATITKLKNEENQSVLQTKVKNIKVTSRSHKRDLLSKSEEPDSASSLSELSKKRRKLAKSAENISGLTKANKATNSKSQSKNNEKTAPVMETEKSSDTPNKETVIKNARGNQKKAAQSKKVAGPKPPNRSILQLKITISDTTPPVWRRIQVLNNDTFYKLHDYINEAVGWITPRAQKFIIPGKKSNIILVDENQERQLASFVDNFTRSPGTFIQQNVKLSKYLKAPGDTIYYEYDIADCWMHEVVVEKILPPPAPKAEYPKCQGGKGACPPEEVGGVDAYNHLVEVYKNPNHEEYDDLINNWLADSEPGWNPEKFDKKKIFKKVWMWVYEGPKN